MPENNNKIRRIEFQVDASNDEPTMTLRSELGETVTFWITKQLAARVRQAGEPPYEPYTISPC